jgi:hypothetical protein
MGFLLLIVGLCWAFIGVVNVVLIPAVTPEAVTRFGLMFNIIVCVLPGLALARYGSRLRRAALKDRGAAKAAAAH